MASNGSNMGHRSPLSAVNEEEPVEDGEVDLANRQCPGPTPMCASLPNKRMSMASVQFDKGNKGFLTEDEESARGMANKDGDVDKGAIVDLIAQNRSMKMGQRRLAGLSLFLLAALVVTGALLGARLDQATASTQVKIDEAVTTEIAQDEEGLPHLVDRASGGELTVRAEGDTFDTRQVVDPVTYRRLDCIPAHEVARMVSNLSHGVAGSVVEHDPDGTSKKIMSLAGNFEDHGRYLQFGSFSVVLDDDGCNRGADIPVFAPGLSPSRVAGPGPAPGEPSRNASNGPAATGEKKGVQGAPASEDVGVDPSLVDIGLALNTAEGGGIGTHLVPNSSAADPFTRGLRRYMETPEQKAAVLHRHRQAYDEAGTSISEGRQEFGFTLTFLVIVMIAAEICSKNDDCRGKFEEVTGCTYEENDMNWGEVSVGFRDTGSPDSCLKELRTGLESCLNLGKCHIDLSGPCGLLAKYTFPTYELKKKEFHDPRDMNINKAKLIVSATVDAEVHADFNFHLDIRFDPTYKDKFLKLSFGAGYSINSSFKLELLMPSSSTHTNHVGTFEVALPLTQYPSNLFRRLFMMGPVPLLVEVDVQPMIWLDIITGSDSTLEFDINSSLDAKFEVNFDIDQLSFETEERIHGEPFKLDNVKLSGDFRATLSARAGSRLTVSINGQPVHLDTGLALRLILDMSPDFNSNQQPCLSGSIGFTSGLEFRMSMESPANVIGKIKTGCVTAASFASGILGLMKSNMLTSCIADKVSWNENSLTGLCDKMYDGIKNAEVFKDTCGAGIIFEDIPISSWVTIVGFQIPPVEAISNGCPSKVVECPSDAVRAVGGGGLTSLLTKCMKQSFDSAMGVIQPSLSDGKTCCPVANTKSCEDCECADGLKCALRWSAVGSARHFCTDGKTGSYCNKNSDCTSASDFCWGTCQAKYSLGRDCSKWPGSNLGHHDRCFSGYCHPETLKCTSQLGRGARCLVDASCKQNEWSDIRCVCDKDIQQPEECMTFTIWPDMHPEQISFKIWNVCDITSKKLAFSHDFSKVESEVEESMAQLGKISDCKDAYDMCPHWAAFGECERNPGFMYKECRLSCVLDCPSRSWLVQKNYIFDCKDEYSNCATRAANGECDIYPEIMFSKCRASCVDDCPSRFKYCGPAASFRFSIDDTNGDGMYGVDDGYGRWEVQYQGVVHKGIGDYGAGTSVTIGDSAKNCPCTRRCGTYPFYGFGDTGDNCSSDTDCFSPNRCLIAEEDRAFSPEGPNRKCYRSDPPVMVRSVKISLPGDGKYLHLSEVQVFATLEGARLDGLDYNQFGEQEHNIARFIDSVRTTSSYYDNQDELYSAYSATKAVDDVTTGNVGDITHTKLESDPWWMVTFGRSHSISRVVVWNRQDCCRERLEGALVLLLDDYGVTIRSYPIWSTDNVPIVFDHIWWG